MNSDRWESFGRLDARVVAQSDQELAGPESLWLLTFEQGAIANVAIVRAHGFFTAMDQARLLGIHPGMPVGGVFKVGEDEIPPSLRDRLLNLADTRALLEKLAEDHCRQCGAAIPLPEPAQERLTKTEARALLRDLAKNP